MRPRTPYEAFWILLKMALAQAETKYKFPGKAVGLYWDLLRLEVQVGVTGFLSGLDPAQAVEDYITYGYAKGPAPVFVTNYEVKVPEASE